MKVLKQFFIILMISFLGEALKACLPFPIPASIYGMLILFLCLFFRVIRLEQVDKAAKFLIEIMPVMFIPAGVGLMESWGVLRPLLLPVLVITVVSLITVFGVSGQMAQIVIRYGKGKKDQEANEQNE